MKEIFFKRSAIHNLIITDSKTVFKEGEICEGIVIPKNILDKSDILPWEQIIVTKIDGDNWVNRLKTFVIEGENNGKVEVRGSLAKFLKKGDLTCLITRTLLNKDELNLYSKNKASIFDLGFDPDKNKDNLIESTLDIENGDHKIKNVSNYKDFVKERKSWNRIILSSLILNLKINKTHPDCLQGSAELPREIMKKGGVSRYQSVSVYNSSKGGIADTYAVPMPPGVVMTTGAMAKFAKKGEKVNVATYVVDSKLSKPNIVFTEGSKLIN